MVGLARLRFVGGVACFLPHACGLLDFKIISLNFFSLLESLSSLMPYGTNRKQGNGNFKVLEIMTSIFL